MFVLTVQNGQTYVWESTWNEEGERVEMVTPVDPYLYFEDKNLKKVTEKSMFGIPVHKLTFHTQNERNQWIDRNKNVLLFEKLSPAKQYLLNKYYRIRANA